MTEKSPGGLIARTAAAHPPARRPRATGCRRLSGPVAAIAAAACAVVPSLATAATPAAAAGKPAPVLYVSDVNARPGTITPVSTATNKPGKPIKVGGSLPDEMAATPNGATVYVADLGSNTVTPVSVATNTAGKPIKVGPFPELRLVVLDALATLPPKARGGGAALLGGPERRAGRRVAWLLDRQRQEPERPVAGQTAGTPR